MRDEGRYQEARVATKRRGSRAETLMRLMARKKPVRPINYDRNSIGISCENR